MPFLVFRWGSFAVRDHLRSSLGIISGLGIICGAVHMCLFFVYVIIFIFYFLCIYNYVDNLNIAIFHKRMKWLVCSIFHFY